MFILVVCGQALGSHITSGHLHYSYIGNQTNLFKLFPNPAEDVFSIHTEAIGQKTLSMMSVSGQVLDEYSFLDSEMTVNTEHYKNGIYLFKVTSESGVEVKRVSIQH